MTFISVESLAIEQSPPISPRLEPIPIGRFRSRKVLQPWLEGLEELKINPTPNFSEPEPEKQDRLDLSIPKNQMLLPLEYPGEARLNIMTRFFKEPELIALAMQLGLVRPGDIHKAEFSSLVSREIGLRFLLAVTSHS